MLKDVVDLHRSQGGFGKVIFSFLIPVLVVEVMISFILKAFSISSEGLLLLVSVVIGVTASTTYNWLTEFDDYRKYLNIPVSTRKIAFSKALLSFLIGGLSGAGLLVLSFLFSEAALTSLVIAFAVFLVVFIITLSVLVYLTGLTPNLLLFRAQTFAKYILILAPVIVFFMFQGFVYSGLQDSLLILTVSALLIPVSLVFFKKGLGKISVYE
jgi:hypothetical protein